MKTAITLSLGLNILVLIPVCFGLWSNAPWASESYGTDGVARGILLAVYASILIASIGLMIKPLPSAVCTLLALQVAYKLLSPLAAGTLSNPVILSNLGIAGVHLITLAVIGRALWR